MSVLIAPETPYGKELWKFDHPRGMTHPSDPTVKGVSAPHFEPYPAMLYKVVSSNPWKFEGAIVKDEGEQRNFESRGFVAGGQGAAVDAYKAYKQEMAELAAARNYEDRNMSDNAKAERDAVEQASSSHLGEIPETAIRRGPGRPRKEPE